MNTDTLPMLSPQDWAMLRDHVRLVPYRRGSVILSEGGYRRALHIVKNGAVRVEEEQEGHGITLAMLGPGEIFGEMGFVENAPASATVVVAQDDAEIEVIEDAALESLMASEPGFAVRFYHSIAIALSRRLRITSQRLAQTGIAEVAQVNKFRVARTGNISTRQVPPELSTGLTRPRHVRQRRRRAPAIHRARPARGNGLERSVGIPRSGAPGSRHRRLRVPRDLPHLHAERGHFALLCQAARLSRRLRNHGGHLCQ
jgi:CRP/FNR family transcriptional regulator, cyclic AMP receptor protein